MGSLDTFLKLDIQIKIVAKFGEIATTRKVKTKRVYRCVPAGEPCPEGWEVVLGRCGGGGGDNGGGGRLSKPPHVRRLNSSCV